MPKSFSTPTKQKNSAFAANVCYEYIPNLHIKQTTAYRITVFSFLDTPLDVMK